MNTSRRTLFAAAAGLPFAAQGMRSAQAQARWQFATPYQDTNFHTRNNRQFVEELEKATGGRVGVQLHTNQSLLPQPQIKRGVQSGQVQLGEILLSAYGNEDPMFEVDGIPQLVTSFPQAKKLLELARPFIEARFARQGMTVLYHVPWPPSGFYTNTPVPTLETLRGNKMRTFNVLTNRFATLIGATPTLVQAAEIPQAFATGVVNAMVTSAATGVDTQAWDYAKYFTPIGFTFTRNCVFASRRAVEALSERDRQTLREVANAAENRGWEASQKAKVDQEAMLASKGMQVMQPSTALMDGMAAVGRTMADEWLAKAGPDGKTLLDAYRA
jgi:TRAP-type C4-dicarboxylate transport system substrate-binding protein